MDFRRARKTRLVCGQRFTNHCGEAIAPGCVDDPRGIHARNRRVLHDMVRAIQQFLDEIGARAERRGKAPVQPFDGMRERDRHVALGLQIDLDEPLRRFAQKAGFLLDDHHASGGTDDHEVGLAEHREVLVQTRPVHAVINGVVFRQRLFEQRKGFAFARRRAGGGEALPVVGDNAGHAVPRRFAVRSLYATHHAVRGALACKACASCIVTG
ncbi:hypothetical protein ABIE53_006478 [Burkholderia sp. OAS925]